VTSPAIELEAVSKRFGPRVVLRDLNLRVETGEIAGFVGPNGCGKTTSLRLIAGITFRTAGRASVLGRDPTREPVAIRRRCSYLPGETCLYEWMTGSQALRFALAGYPQRDSELDDELRDTFALPLHRRVREYSAGMKQKLALHIALVPDVDLYLLDEPDRNLDPTSQFLVRSIVRRMARQRKTVLYCSHDLRNVEALADRIIFIHDGRAVAPESVLSARDALRGELRILVAPGTELPKDSAEVIEDPDGYLRVRTSGDPFQWLGRIDPGAIVAVEFGTTRLDLLYRELTAKDDHA